MILFVLSESEWSKGLKSCYLFSLTVNSRFNVYWMKHSRVLLLYKKPKEFSKIHDMWTLFVILFCFKKATSCIAQVMTIYCILDLNTYHQIGEETWQLTIMVFTANQHHYHRYPVSHFCGDGLLHGVQGPR